MLDRIRKFIEKEEMLKSGDRVIVGVSGGADSVCLLSVLCALAPEQSLSLRVVHIHHGLRGEEADRDETFVRELCERLGVPFETVRCDVRGYAAKRGISVEEAGRLLRYEAFNAAAAAWSQEMKEGERAPWVALAHHRDDNAETIVHHLLRGSGLRGLGGIRPVQGNRIRPLLCVGREEIRDYLYEQGLSWCEDSTNRSGEYTRNRIRSELLPMMEKLVNARVADHILQAGEQIARADDYLERQAKKVWDQAGCLQNGQAVIRLSAFLEQEKIIRTYLVRRMLDEAAPGWKNITGRHFAEIEALAFRAVGSRLDLPGRLTARVGYETLEIGCGKDADSDTDGDTETRTDEEDCREIESLMPGNGGQEKTGVLRMKGRLTLRMKVFSLKKGAEIPKNQCTKWFDYAKIKRVLSLRVRGEGDYLTLSGGGRKRLTRYMIDEKIPRKQRAGIPVLAEGNHVLWVIGYRISEYYKVTADTEWVLQVTAVCETDGEDGKPTSL